MCSALVAQSGPYQPGGHTTSYDGTGEGQPGAFGCRPLRRVRAEPRPAAITLADVYFAVEDESVFRMHKTNPESGCPVAAQLGKILSVPLRAAECALHTSLAKTSIRDVATAIV